MNVVKGKISNLQLMFITVSFILGSLTFVSFADTLTRHDTWLVIIAAYVLSIPFVLSYVLLCKRFPGMNLIQINDVVFGPFLGKFFSALYIWFILTLLSLNLKGMADFYIGFVIPDSPNILVLIICALVCAYAVHKGLECIIRISSVIFGIGVFISVISFLLLLGKMDFSNFLPILEISPKIFLQGVHIIMAIQLCEIFVFLMIIPSLNDNKRAGKYTFLALTIASFLLMSISVRNTAVLGITSPIYFSDSYQSFRLIDIGNVLTRMDVLFAIGITILMFMKICVLYYVTVSCLSQVMHLRSIKPLILPVGGIAVCLSLILFNSLLEHTFNAENYYPILASLFEFILPPLSLLIAKIRGLPKQKGGN